MGWCGAEERRQQGTNVHCVDLKLTNPEFFVTFSDYHMIKHVECRGLRMRTTTELTTLKSYNYQSALLTAILHQEVLLRSP